jgi:hypothetical protein
MQRAKKASRPRLCPHTLAVRRPRRNIAAFSIAEDEDVAVTQLAKETGCLAGKCYLTLPGPKLMMIILQCNRQSPDSSLSLVENVWWHSLACHPREEPTRLSLR